MKKSGFRVLAQLAALIMLITVFPMSAGSAESFATFGDGSTIVTFFVQSGGSAAITFRQTEGLCQELSATHLIDGLLGEEEEWGKYHINIVNPYGGFHTEEWDKTFNGSEYTLSLDWAGKYTITIVPYSASEMTDSWTLDIFSAWTRQPQWWIANTKNCSCYTENSGEVQIHKYLDGSLIDSRTLSITGSQWIYPDTISGCECESSGVYVEFDSKTGVCYPAVIDFQYSRIPKPPASGDVQIRRYLNGTLIDMKTVSIGGSQWIYPDSMPGYDCTPASVYVQFNDQTGACNPAAIDFYYSLSWNNGGAIRSLSQLPRLSAYSAYETVLGYGSIPVYTGPGTNYYRSATGKAAVNGGEAVTIYGRTDDWLLIRYSAYQSVKDIYITRFAFIPANQIDRGAKYAEMNLAYVPISITYGADLGDEPSATHCYNSFYAGTIQYQNAYALAQITENGVDWIYFEAWAESAQGYLPFRGFVQDRYVTLR